MQSDGIPETRETPEDDELMSVKAAARDLRVSPVMVYRRFHAGVFPGVRIGRRISLSRPFVSALLAAISAGGSIDVEDFARSWKQAKAAKAAA